jgi:hypothetical protein
MFEHRIFFHVFDGIHFNLIPDPRPQPPLLLHLHRLPQERAGTSRMLMNHNKKSPQSQTQPSGQTPNCRLFSQRFGKYLVKIW